MPVSTVDISALAASLSITEAELRWLLEQLSPRGFGASLQADPTMVALAVDGLSGIAAHQEYFAFATIDGSGGRTAKFIAIAGAVIDFDINVTTGVETLTLTTQGQTSSLALDPSGTIHIDTVQAVYEQLRNEIVRSRV